VRAFYALPQAPQQFKQLLMIAGCERYYQIARCSVTKICERLSTCEFTQLDMELSFVEQEDILELNETMFSSIIADLLPDKKLPKSFQRLTYQEAMAKYDSDKPDLRTDKKDDDELAFAWITDFPMFERNAQGQITFAHNPLLTTRVHLLDSDNPDDLLSYDLVLNGYEIEW
jgi:aspartyl-tRNA synthetase